MANFVNIPQVNEQDGIPWRACDKINRAFQSIVDLVYKKVVYERSPSYAATRAELAATRAELAAAQADVKDLEARVASLESRV